MTAAFIRRMAVAQAPALREELAEQSPTDGDTRGTPPGAEALLRTFLGPRAAGRLLVAEAEGVPVGYATLHVTYETEFAARGCYLGDLYVRPEARRQGIGRALLAAAARLVVRAEGGGHLWWTALPRNAGSHAFYRAVGAADEPIQAFVLAFDAFDRLAGEDAT